MSLYEDTTDINYDGYRLLLRRMISDAVEYVLKYRSKGGNNEQYNDEIEFLGNLDPRLLELAGFTNSHSMHDNIRGLIDG